MTWFLYYLAVGFVIALISYRFQRRNRNVRKVKKVGGVFSVIMFYMWLWPLGLVFDLKELVSRGKVNEKGKWWFNLEIVNGFLIVPP